MDYYFSTIDRKKDLLKYNQKKATTCSVHLFVEIEETFGAVNVVERWERLDGAINGHRVKSHRSTRCDQHPVRRRSTDKHLSNKKEGKITHAALKRNVLTSTAEISFNKCTPEYPEMSSKYLNLAIRLFVEKLSSIAPLSAFLSFLSFAFFSLKLMLWGTCANVSQLRLKPN